MRRTLFRYLRPHRRYLVAAIAMMIATSAIDLASPWPLKIVLDNVLGGRPLAGRTIQPDQRTLAFILAGVAYLVLALMQGLAGMLGGRWVAIVTGRSGLDLRRDMYTQTQRLSLRFHDRSRVGDLVTRLTGDVERLQDLFVNGVSMLAVDLLTLAGMAVVMAAVDWQFALVSLVVLPPLFVVFSVFRKRMRVASRQVRAGEGAMASMAQEVLSSIRAVKALGAEDSERARFTAQTKETRKRPSVKPPSRSCSPRRWRWRWPPPPGPAWWWATEDGGSGRTSSPWASWCCSCNT
jgi:subfamily B ATP-binding cassette protein MsbA